MSVPWSVVITRGASALIGCGDHLLRHERRGGVRNRVVRMHDVEPDLARDLHDLVGERQQVLGLAEQRIRGRDDLVKRESLLVFAQPERRLRADHVHLVPPARQRLPELGGHDAAPANRRVADDPDVHPRSAFQQVRCQDWMPDDEPFGVRDADLRSELRVAALDELVKAGGGQARGDGVSQTRAKTASRDRRARAASLS